MARRREGVGLVLWIAMMSCVTLHDVSAQSSIAGVGTCDQSTVMTYIQDPTDACRVYGCINGQFVMPQSFSCPQDATVLPGPNSPCSHCRQQQQQPQQSQSAGSPFGSSNFNAFINQLLANNAGLVPPVNSRFVVPQYTTATQQAPSGFVSAVSGVQLPGGYRLLVSATLRQCLDACLMTSYCLAADYDSTAGDCYVHGTATYCNDVISQTNVDHYERVTCSAAAGVSNGAVEVWSGYRVALTTTTTTSGFPVVRPLCTRCRLVDCLVQCYSVSDKCAAVDYDTTATTCYLLNSTLACSSLTPASNFIHVATTRCSTSVGTGSGNGASLQSGGNSGSIYNNFVAVRFLGPTSLPLNWLGYPGSRVIGGTIVARGTTGDYCVSLCQLYSSCKAVDFDSRDGTCWAHTTELTKCAAPIPTNYVYHVKKPPACGYITGTYQAYPLPVTIGASQL